MQQAQDIIVVVDYHAENIDFRWFNEATGEGGHFELASPANATPRKTTGGHIGPPA